MRVIKKNKTVLSCQEGASLYPDTPIAVIQHIEYVSMGPGTRFKRPFEVFCWKELQFRVLGCPSIAFDVKPIHPFFILQPTSGYDGCAGARLGGGAAWDRKNIRRDRLCSPGQASL